MGIKAKIYCGHDFREEEARLNSVVQACKVADVQIPQEVQDKLMKISDGFNQVKLNVELEINADGVKRFRVKASEIAKTETEFVYFEMEQFKTDKTMTDEEETLELADIMLADPEKGPIKKFFSKDEGDIFEALN